MSKWFDQSANANKLRQSYLKGFLDISGGGIMLRTDNSLNIFSKNLAESVPTFGVDSSSISVVDPTNSAARVKVPHTKLGYITDLSMNVQNVLSDYLAYKSALSSNSGNVNAAATTTKTLNVTGNTNLNGKLTVGGNAQFNSNVAIAKDLSVGGNVLISGSETIMCDLNVHGDAHFYSRAFVQSHLFVYGTGSNLYVDSAVNAGGDIWTSNGNVRAKKDLDVSGAAFINGATAITGALTVTGATALRSTLDVTGITKITGDTRITGGTLNVTGATQITGNFTVRTNSGTVALTGVTNITGATTITGALTASQLGTFNNGITVNGTVATFNAGISVPAGYGMTADTVTATSSAVIGSTLDVTGATTLGDALSVTGATALASTLNVTGATTLASTLDVTGALTVTGATQLNNTLQVGTNSSAKAATFFGKHNVTGDASFNGNVTVSTRLDVPKILATDVSAARFQSGNLFVNGPNYKGSSYQNSISVTSGDIDIVPGSANNAVHIRGGLTVDGSINFIGQYTQVDTTITTTDIFDISNNGTGVALRVGQSGVQPIAMFYDGASTCMVVDATGKVGIGAGWAYTVANDPNNILPTYDLDVKGSGHINTDLTVDGNYSSAAGSLTLTGGSLTVTNGKITTKTLEVTTTSAFNGTATFGAKLILGTGSGVAGLLEQFFDQ